MLKHLKKNQVFFAEKNWEVEASPAEVRRGSVAACLSDRESLMMLDSCPQRRRSASAWWSYRWSHPRNRAQSCRGVDFTPKQTRVFNSHSVCKLSEGGSPLLWQGLQWGRGPTYSSPDSHHHPLYETWSWLCAEGENENGERITLLIASRLIRLTQWRWLLSREFKPETRLWMRTCHSP